MSQAHLAGELVTTSSLPNAAVWEAFTAARLGLRPNLSLDHAAERYRPVEGAGA